MTSLRYIIPGPLADLPRLWVPLLAGERVADVGALNHVNRLQNLASAATPLPVSLVRAGPGQTVATNRKAAD